VILLSVALGFLVMTWSENLWGKSAGLLALCLYAFDPTITAHSQVVTTDVGVAFFATLYLFQLRAYLKNPSNFRLITASVALGFALGSKFSAIVLFPISVCLIFIDLQYEAKGTEHTLESSHPLGRQVNWKKLVLRLVWRMTFISVVASTVVWLLYFCPLDPWFYLKGIWSVHRDHPSNSFYYLMGTLQPGNRKYYLLIAWLIKTPLPSLILLIIAVWLCFRGKRAAPIEEAFLLLPSIGFMLFYSFLGDNIGVRYLIPCFPFLFIFAARICSSAIRDRVYRIVVVALLVWHVAEWLSISPDHLSYFNQIAGGATKGVDWLDNSNVDWGQGLFQLRDFLHREQINDFAFFYFGTGDPAYYGIHGRRIEDFTFMLHPTYGTLVLSAHAIPRTRDILYRVFGDGRSNWLLHLKPRAIVGHSYFIYDIR